MRALSLRSARGRSAGVSGETGVAVVAGFMDRVLSAVLWKTVKTASGERLFACGKFGGGVPRVGEEQAKAPISCGQPFRSRRERVRRFVSLIHLGYGLDHEMQ